MANQKQNRGAQSLHPRNPHAGRYDFPALCVSCPDLRAFLRPNPAGDQTIDFADPEAVLCLNRALLAHHYGVTRWQIPTGYLCPPIPGRADYVHHLADFLEAADKGDAVRGLDIGVGANCVYPIVGHRSYGWRFVGSDLDPEAVENAREIVAANPVLGDAISIVRQERPRSIFDGVIGAGERFDFTMCNPPFFASADDARDANRRKVEKLGAGEGRNFGGQKAELWCPGGERKFITRMIKESAGFAAQVGWFTTLVSKAEHLAPLKSRLTGVGADRVEVVEMAQGQKRSRFLAWRFA